MSTGISSDILLETAKGSPKAVAKKDKEAWVSLFSRYSIVEDPVGSQPNITGIWDRRSGYRGNAPRRRFYDTFIAPNQIDFHADADIVADPIVARDLTIELKMPTGTTAYVPMHLFYEMTVENGQPRIQNLTAHWELIPMVLQVISKGKPGISGMIKLFVQMIKNQGLGGVLGFCKGFFWIHKKGKAIADQLIRKVNRKESVNFIELFDAKNGGIAFPAGKPPLTPANFMSQVDTTLSVSKVISAGYMTTFSFRELIKNREYPGIGLLEFNRKSKKIYKATFFRSYAENDDNISGE